MAGPESRRGVVGDPPPGVEPFVCVTRVRFEDIDGMGHANNARYLTYLEEARLEWAREVVGLDGVRDLGFILAHAAVDFIRPARIAALLRVEMWVPRIGTKSWDFAYRVQEGEGGPVVARAVTTQVMFDYARGVPVAVPEKHRGLLSRLAGPDVGDR